MQPYEKNLDGYCQAVLEQFPNILQLSRLAQNIQKTIQDLNGLQAGIPPTLKNFELTDKTELYSVINYLSQLLPTS